LLALLEAEGCRGEAISSARLMGEVMADIQERNPTVVCVSAVPPDATIHSRVMCRRLHGRFAQVQLMAGVWNASKDPVAANEQLGAAGVDHVVTTMVGALERLKAALAPVRDEATQAAPQNV
jgi:hypothetical protein